MPASKPSNPLPSQMDDDNPERDLIRSSDCALLSANDINGNQHNPANRRTNGKHHTVHHTTSPTIPGNSPFPGDQLASTSSHMGHEGNANGRGNWKRPAHMTSVEDEAKNVESGNSLGEKIRKSPLGGDGETVSSGNSPSMAEAFHGTGADQEEVRTLFISGLPMDVKARELYLLFRGYEGYESSMLKVTGKVGKPSSPVGFVTFAGRPQAEIVRQELQFFRGSLLNLRLRTISSTVGGVRFDPDSMQTLRLEFAKSNTKVPKPRLAPAGPSPLSAPTNVTCPSAAVLNGGAGLFLSGHHPNGYPAVSEAGTVNCDGMNWPWSLQHLAALQSYMGAAACPSADYTNPEQLAAMMGAFNHPSYFPSLSHQIANANPNPSSFALPSANHNLLAAAFAGSASGPAPVGTNPPCNTLFIANLGTNVSELEIRHLFSSFPGFSRCRLNSNGKLMPSNGTTNGCPNGHAGAVAFVDFADIRCATNALLSLQGVKLSSSPSTGVGIRIEYAKQKMADIP